MYMVLLLVVETTSGPHYIQKRTGKLLDGENFGELGQQHFQSFWQLMGYIHHLFSMYYVTQTYSFNRSVRPSTCHTRTQMNSTEALTISYLYGHNSNIRRLYRVVKSWSIMHMILSSVFMLCEVTQILRVTWFLSLNNFMQIKTWQSGFTMRWTQESGGGDTLAVVWEVQCTKTKLIIVSWGWVRFGCYCNIWQLLGVCGVQSGNHNI